MKSLSVLNKLKEKGLQISFAESMTGGKIVSELIKHPSASSVCSLGIVTYSDKVKNSWLDVPLETIRKYGVVSKEVSVIMAENVKNKTHSHISVSVTGNAGPTASLNSNVGEVWVSICVLENVKSYYFKFENLTREEIIKKTTIKVYELLDELL